MAIHAFTLERMGRPIFVISAAIIGILVLTAVAADWIIPHDPNVVKLEDKFLPPFWLDGGRMAYPLGTDSLGRDLLSRIIMGARVSLMVAAAAIIAAGGTGTVLGLLAGYCGKIVDEIIMRTVDGLLAIPTILLAMLLAIVFGPGIGNLILVITILVWARFARVVRGDVLSLKTRDYIALAKVAGASSFRIMLYHLFPNVLNTVIVMATLQVGYVIILEASLSFLGVGIPPPHPTWGYMISTGRSHLATAWWISAFPGLAILLTVLALNLLGDWLRDTLDPKLRQI